LEQIQEKKRMIIFCDHANLFHNLEELKIRKEKHLKSDRIKFKTNKINIKDYTPIPIVFPIPAIITVEPFSVLFLTAIFIFSTNFGTL